MEVLWFIVKYLLIFFVGALIGYLIELFYRRFISQKKWMNPGFLTGPYLPLYGFGLVILYVICELNLNFKDFSLEVILKTLLILFSMTLIEFIAGLIFIKGMKIKLWDYSDQKGNILGIVCPLYSLFWGVIGFIYYIFIHQFICDIITGWSKNPILSFFVGAIFGIFILDVFNNINLATKISKYAYKEKMVVQYHLMKSTIKELPGRLKDRINNATESYKEKLKLFMEEMEENKNDRMAIIGFITSFVGFLVFPALLSKFGLKSEKYHKLALAGLIISLINIGLLIIFGIILRS